MANNVLRNLATVAKAQRTTDNGVSGKINSFRRIDVPDIDSFKADLTRQILALVDQRLSEMKREMIGEFDRIPFKHLTGFTSSSPSDVIQSGASYTVTNATGDRTYDANDTSLNEIADVLGTLISDLKLTRIIK